ncbi:MAG: hypothetical protein HY830_14040 [Actinobacteria bacterium]|nr:hypothetical protein [Actinomycetota bacterium]
MADQYVLGGVVPLTVEVCDADGLPANAGAHALAMTRDGVSTGESLTLTNPETGRYQLDYTPAQVGRYVAVATFTGANAGVAVDVFDVLAAGLSVVTLADVQAYLGDVSWTGPEIQQALDAERAAQRRRCRVDDYGHDLREALCRRVARNLAARAVPVASFTSFEGGATSTRVPTKDPEISRLEGPYLRMVVG